MGIPVIDVTALRDQDAGALAVALEIDRACRESGFFYAAGHGVDESLVTELDSAARSFFVLPEEEKAAIAMDRAGAAWRGWFPVGAELTDGRPDRKEGIYFGAEHGDDHPRVTAGVPLHGPNLFPVRPPELRGLVLAYLDAMTTLGHTLLEGMALALGHEADWFRSTMTADPTTLFRIFHYPPQLGEDDAWGVGEHTDYGLLTILRQDHTGGLELHTPGGWVDAPPVADTFICNLGNIIERVSGGRYRSTPHRVRNTSGESRVSMPFFFDPAWDARVPGADGFEEADGTYGDELLGRVARVFPELAQRAALPNRER